MRQVIHMHEAGIVGAAIERVVRGWPASRTGGRLELEIRDATRAEAGAVAFYASAILADRGFTDVDVAVSSAEVRCALCDEVAPSASPADPQCHACGAPLPRVEGPAVVCREPAATSLGQADIMAEAAPCA